MNDKQLNEVKDPTPLADCVRINVVLPAYLLAELKTKTSNDRSTIRYEFMRALRRVGYTVHKVDMIKDARRGKFIRQKIYSD